MINKHGFHNKKGKMSMSKLYFITGPAGVGKSTVSKKIAESKEKSVLLEGDEVYHHVIGGYVPAWKENNHLDIFWKVCIDTIKNYLNAGYDVVFNYIMMPKDLKMLQDHFKDYETKFVVLLVDEKSILSRDKERREDCQMKDRCLVLLQNFKSANFPENYILDTTKLSVEETVNEIIEKERFQV